jgi:bacteriochlorophyll 4-vinyl reductase
MSEPRIGRVVVASLHQALADCLPLRLEFYEDYLRPTRLREGRVGAASFLAALSFLRREDEAWAPVMARAGRHAADWEFDARSALQRGWLRRLPASLRLRAVLRIARSLVSDTTPASRARSRVSGGVARLEIAHSAFCEVREPTTTPLCHFYRAAVERLAERLEVDVRVTWHRCRAMGDQACELEVSTVSPSGGRAATGASAS